MHDAISAALQAATDSGASYADARVVHTDQEAIEVASGRLEGVQRDESAGIGVRVLARGAWGFAAVNDTGPDAAAAVARKAVAIAHASARVSGDPIELSPIEPQVGSWEGACAVDPFAVPLGEKLSLLLAAEERLRAQKGVRVSKASLGAYRFHKWFGSTEGSDVEQTWTETGAGIAATAVDDTDVCTRSYPDSHGGGWEQRGWEFVEGLDIVGNAQRVAEEAAALLSAEECPAGVYDLIIGGSQLALQVHESVGHPTELDRVLGEEAAFAGTSWVSTDDLGSLRYGSPLMNVTADATVPGSLGSFGWDDDGVPASRDFIVKEGVLAGFLGSRETAARLGIASNGTMRADGWNRIPLIRMTTVSLEPGTWDFDALVADTEHGMLVETNESWSIDDKRLNFQFGCEIGWLIEDGVITKMIRKPNYTGITPEFWGSLDAVCSAKHWKVWGIPNCGKGEPVQVAHVAHGAAPARFRNVQVGVGRP